MPLCRRTRDSSQLLARDLIGKTLTLRASQTAWCITRITSGILTVRHADNRTTVVDWPTLRGYIRDGYIIVDSAT